jgi:hypothetical protein
MTLFEFRNDLGKYLSAKASRPLYGALARLASLTITAEEKRNINCDKI